MKTQDLSPAEIWLLNLIYELGEADVYQIQERVLTEKNWKYSTVITLSNRLYDKGYLNRTKVGRRYVYSAKFPRVRFFEQVMDRLFGKSLLKDPSVLFTYLLNVKKLSKKEEMPRFRKVNPGMLSMN